MSKPLPLPAGCVVKDLANTYPALMARAVHFHVKGCFTRIGHASSVYASGEEAYLHVFYATAGDFTASVLRQAATNHVEVKGQESLVTAHFLDLVTSEDLSSVFGPQHFVAAHVFSSFALPPQEDYLTVQLRTNGGANLSFSVVGHRTYTELQ